MSNFYQQKSKFENIKSALLTEIGRGVIRLAPALAVLYLATKYLGVGIFGVVTANPWVNFGVLIAFAAWIIYKKIAFFTFLLSVVINFAITSKVPFGITELRELSDPFLSAVTTISFAIFVSMAVLSIFKAFTEACVASAAKEAVIEAAKTPGQRFADAQASQERDEQESREKEQEEQDARDRQVQEHMDQLWWDAHHKN